MVSTCIRSGKGCGCGCVIPTPQFLISHLGFKLLSSTPSHHCRGGRPDRSPSVSVTPGSTYSIVFQVGFLHYQAKRWTSPHPIIPQCKWHCSSLPKPHPIGICRNGTCTSGTFVHVLLTFLLQHFIPRPWSSILSPSTSPFLSYLPSPLPPPSLRGSLHPSAGQCRATGQTLQGQPPH